jgi:hypothetical protein
MTKTKYNKKRKYLKKTRKTNNKNTRKRKALNGGFLEEMGFGINGMNFSQNTGKKQYNWKTGKWDAMNCYDVGGLKWCKIVPNEEQ